MKFAKEGWPLIGLFAGVSAAVTAASFFWLGPWGWAALAVGAILTGWCLWFFRDPERNIPSVPGAIVSPADGVVCQIADSEFPREIGEGGKGPRVCVFMNVFDVHVNRAPCAGTVQKLAYTKGSFVNAAFDKASTENERMAVLMRTDGGRPIVFVQIAGLVARRIVCKLKELQHVETGERFGLIRFGSRVDVYLPAGSQVLVKVGDRAVAGETVLAKLPE